MRSGGGSIGAILVAVWLAQLSPDSCLGQSVYGSTPDWVSADTPYSTGGALVDLDHDGWLDFVVANGNDMRRERLAVYYNNGDGTLPVSPDWLAGDSEYNGHLSVADVNGDGWLDVAVGLTMDDPGTATARLYLNNEGTLSSLPDWSSLDEVAAFHVAFGDVNGDGLPDLAVGTGFAYEGSHRWHNYVYLNVGGTLELSPSWVSADTWDYWDIFFCDVDDDGWLDLVGIGGGTYTWVYQNDEGTLDAVASWQTMDNSGQFSLGGTYGDVDADGWVDLFVSDNTQLSGGSGYFRRYDGLPGGLFTTTPTWTFYQQYGSVVTLADIDADGDLDLFTGGWWGYTRYFLNTDGLFPAAPDWRSGGTSVVETICFGDVDKDGVRRPVETFDVSATPGRHVFKLARQPIEGIVYILVDGVPLNPDQYTFGPIHGWISVGPEPATSVTVRYSYTLKPEMAIANWDDNRGNYLYYNLNDAGRFGDFDRDEDVDLVDFADYVQCMDGPDEPVTFDCAQVFDSDGDSDVDMADFLDLQAVFTGSR